MKRRVCEDVIDEIIATVPVKETELISELYEDKEYAERQPLNDNSQWWRVTHTLYNNIHFPTEKWQYEAMSIFSEKSVEELKIYYSKFYN